jgi:hypothetical protein
VQFLHAFFRRGALGLNGSHVGTGRSRSAGVSRDSASIEGVEGEFKVQSAFLEDLRSGSIMRRGRATAGKEDLFLRVSDVPGKCAGFCAMIVPSSARADSTVNPARVSSEVRVIRSVERFKSWRVPRAIKPESTWGSKTGRLGSSASYSGGESVMCTDA